MKSLLKWPGSKNKIVERIRDALPPAEILIEPFVGSGSVFLNTEFDFYILGDINPDLISLYQCIQSEGMDFIRYCQSFFVPENNRKEVYLACREQFNHTSDMHLRSALFLYLTRHAYNGLVRYSKRGFNVPFGSYTKPYFPESELLFFLEKSKRATFLCTDFRTLFHESLHLPASTVIYADPPYLPITSRPSFSDYYAGGFTEEDQRDLARLANKVSERNVPVVISNHDTLFARQLYEGADIYSFSVSRTINCKGDGRKPVMELLAVFNTKANFDVQKTVPASYNMC